MAETYADYSDYEAKPQGTDLELLTGLAGRLVDIDADVKKAEAEVKRLKAKSRELSWDSIPELMEKLGIASFKLKDGSEITVKKEIRMELPKDPDKRAEVMLWLNENGAEELMKRCFEISFSKGDEAWAAKFERDCKQRKKPLDIARLESIHASTLKKFLNDKLEAGEKVPLEKLGAFRQTIAKVK